MLLVCLSGSLVYLSMTFTRMKPCLSRSFAPSWVMASLISVMREYGVSILLRLCFPAPLSVMASAGAARS